LTEILSLNILCDAWFFLLQLHSFIGLIKDVYVRHRDLSKRELFRHLNGPISYNRSDQRKNADDSVRNDEGWIDMDIMTIVLVAVCVVAMGVAAVMSYRR